MDRDLARELDRWLTTDPNDKVCLTCEGDGFITENDKEVRDCPNCVDPTLAED